MESDVKKQSLSWKQKLTIDLLNLALLFFMIGWVALIWQYNDQYFQDQTEFNCVLEPITQQPLDLQCREMIKAAQKISLIKLFALISLILRTIAWYYWIVPNNDPFKIWLRKKIQDETDKTN